MRAFMGAQPPQPLEAFRSQKPLEAPRERPRPPLKVHFGCWHVANLAGSQLWFVLDLPKSTFQL